MTNARCTLLRLAPLLWLLLLLACGDATVHTTVQCSASNCAGCCDQGGKCLDGTASSACGLNGGACRSCAAALTCNAGTCGSASATGGGAASAGGGAGTGGFSGAGGGLSDGCSEAAKLIYVVESNRTVSSFNPQWVGKANPFTSIGQINCPASGNGQPFSMSVDRNAVGWVIYNNGELFTVDLTQASLPCTKTSFSPQQGVARFGMGFVADNPQGANDTLFISGSGLNSDLSSTTFATLGTAPPYAITSLATLTGAPELTGTGDAKLWAFFPSATAPQVWQLDKTTGAALTTFNASALQGKPTAWAFAFWGGDFFIFLMRQSESETHVWRMNGQTGAVSDVVPVTGRHVVGAGVSTCAPITIN
jgi:hypothetical protein